MGIILFLRLGSAGICLRRWAEGCGLRSFFFDAVRPIGLGSSFIFLRCPEEKRTKKKGAQSGKRTRPMASNSFSRGGRHRKRHLHNPQGTKDTCTQGREKNPAYGFRLLFPGQETLAEGLFYIVVSSIHYINGAARKPAGRSEFVCKPCPFLLNKRGGRLTREKLSERSEFFSRSEPPSFGDFSSGRRRKVTEKPSPAGRGNKNKALKLAPPEADTLIRPYPFIIKGYGRSASAMPLYL